MVDNSLTSLFVICFIGSITMKTGMGNDENEVPTDFGSIVSEFSVKVLKEQSKLTEGNVILSPSSIATVLAILQQGARDNSLNQITDSLKLKPEEAKKGFQNEIKSLLRDKKEVTLNWGNRLYVKPGFNLNDTFNQTISENFGAVIEELNFLEPSPQEAAEKMNSWVKEVTQNNIQNLITPALLKADTSFVVLNAIYFKGNWDVPFKKLLTKPEKFELTPDNSIEVPFMAQKERFIAGENPEVGIKWVDLPFKDEQFSMTFVLPTEKHELSKLLEKFDESLLNKIMRDKNTRYVTLQLPKFKLTEKVFLSEVLKQIGIKDLFTSEANFEGISPHLRNIAVSRIIHQANVEIDEAGATAAAATGFVNELLSPLASPDILDFKADHPFLFFILDRLNKIPLFAGKIANPTS